MGIKKFKYDVFLSHNSKDKPAIRKLAERLREDKLRVWFDEWVIRTGDDIYLQIEKGLEESRVLVLALSPNALGSDWVDLERSTSLFRDPANRQRRFVPLLLADCDIPDTLRRYKYIDFRRSGKRDSAYKELLTACQPEPITSEFTGDVSSLDGQNDDQDPLFNSSNGRKSIMSTRKDADTVNTGGGAHIGGNVNTGGGDFVGRDKVTTAGERGVAIGGNVTNSNIVIGDGNVVSNTVAQSEQGVTREAFLALLAEIGGLIRQAGLEDRKARALTYVETEAKADKPDIDFILSQLEDLTNVMKTSGERTDAGKKLLSLLAQAATWAKKLFGA